MKVKTFFDNQTSTFTHKDLISFKNLPYPYRWALVKNDSERVKYE